MDGKKICAVTGSNGYVGGCLKNYFAARGWEIRELTRRPEPGSRAVKFQLGGEISPAALAGAGALVHCAYDFKPLTLAEIRAVNVAGTEKLFRAARVAGVKKVVCVSTISAFEGCQSLYGKAKLEIEKIALHHGAAVIRPGLVYGEGPGLRHAEASATDADFLKTPANANMGNSAATAAQAGGMFGKLAAQVRKSSLIPLIGDGSQIQFLVHQEDLCAFVEKIAAGKTEIPPRVLTAANPEPWQFKKLLLEIARGLDKKIKFAPLPWRLVWLGLKSAETCGLRLNFRSDSLVSLMHQNPAPDFSPNAALGLHCRPLEIGKLKI